MIVSRLRVISTEVLEFSHCLNLCFGLLHFVMPHRPSIGKIAFRLSLSTMCLLICCPRSIPASLIRLSQVLSGSCCPKLQMVSMMMKDRPCITKGRSGALKARCIAQLPQQFHHPWRCHEHTWWIVLVPLEGKGGRQPKQNLTQFQRDKRLQNYNWYHCSAVKRRIMHKEVACLPFFILSPSFCLNCRYISNVGASLLLRTHTTPCIRYN